MSDLMYLAFGVTALWLFGAGYCVGAANVRREQRRRQYYPAMPRRVPDIPTPPPPPTAGRRAGGLKPRDPAQVAKQRRVEWYTKKETPVVKR